MSSGSPAAHLRANNLVTYVAIAAALCACVFTIGPAQRAIGGIGLAVAALADLFDGKFARLFPLTDEQKRLGVELDSLSDVLSFGLTPVVVLARVLDVTGSARALLVACGLAYVICAVTRLAYYNVTESHASGFIGVPTTLLGIFWSAWLLRAPNVWATDAALLLGAVAMVARMRIPRPRVIVFVGLVLACVALAVAHAIQLGPTNV